MAGRTGAKDLSPGDVVSRYRIVRMIHQGSGLKGSTKVYEAVSGTGDKVAMKVCPKGEAAELERDALILFKKDPRSPHGDAQFVVGLQDFFDEPVLGATFLVLEFGLEGLEHRLRKKNWTLSWAETLEVGHAVGSALEFIHSLGMVCGDVKPANVMKFASGWKLIDMGGATKQESNVREYTSSYCAPELARAFLNGKTAKALSCADVWSYGKIMYEMACGSSAALIDDEGAEGEDGKWRMLEQVAALEGDVVDESKLRFLVLRVMLRGALRCRPPRMSLNTIMTRGFWTGNVTSSAGPRSYSTSDMEEEDSASSAKRKKAVLELLETETEYCARLRALRDCFIVPLRNKKNIVFDDAKSGVDMKVFDDVEVLLRSNEFFLRQLRARVEKEGSRCVGDIMGEFARTLLRNYEEYVTRYKDSNEKLQENKRSSREFRCFTQNGVGPQHEPVEYYLILPVQRLMRYKLLLDQIVQHTPDRDSEEFGELQAALAAVNETVDAINDSAACSDLNWKGEASVPSERRALVYQVGGAVAALVVVGLGMWAVREGSRMLQRIQVERMQVEAAKQEALIERAKAEWASKHAAETEAQLKKIIQEKAALENTNTGLTVAGVASAVGLVALMVFSDRRLKRGTNFVRTSPSGLRVYEFSYVWEPEVIWEGVLAQDLLAHEGVSADAVVELGPAGLLCVDYSMLDVKPRVCRVNRRRNKSISS